jgi:beta-xylosidase
MALLQLARRTNTPVRLIAFLRLFLFFAMVTCSKIAISAETPGPVPRVLLNPLGDPSIHLQDPFVFVFAKKYYLIGTASPTEGFQCYESSDLVHWKLDGWAWRKTALRVALGELHGPQVFQYQGMFCLIYSARMPGGTKLALAASTSPEGPYHDLHVPWLSLGDSCGPGHVFVDNNGKPYLIYSQRTSNNGCRFSSIYGVALNDDLSKTIGQPVKLLEANQRWELARRDVARLTESPRMFRMGPKYYLTYGANDATSPEFATGYAVADKPLGSWVKSADNPLLASHADIGVVAPGHACPFRSIDRTEWFVAYDSLADPANPWGDHVVNIDRLLLQDNRKLAVIGPTRSRQLIPSTSK